MTNTENQNVIWKKYPKYPFIEANQFGEVRIRDRVVMRKNGRKYHVKGHVLKQRLNNNGYFRVTFGLNGKTIYLYVHRIMATCFLTNPLGLPEVNHKDNDRKNNSVNNLEWCTKQYNLDHKKKFGTSPADVQGRSVIAINLETSEVFWFESQSAAARQLGAHGGHINDVLKGKRNKTHDFWFCYADETAVETVRAKFGNEVAKEAEKLINDKL